jgi:Rieske Fe-S protein
MNPAADTLALSTTEVNLEPIKKGMGITVVWRGKPVFIRHRTADEIRAAEAVKPEELIDPETDSANAQARVASVVGDGSSDEEDACCYEDPGMYYVESSQQERDRMFGAIEDTEEREKQYRDWCVSIDQIELGYG